MAALVFETILFVFLLVSFGISTWIFLFRRKYTRERFAFFVISNYVSVIVLAIQYLLSPNLIISAINYVLVNFFQQPEIQFDEPQLIDKLIAAMLFFVFFYFVTKFANIIYKNWGDGRSIKESKTIHFNNSILLGAGNFIKDKSSRILAHDQHIAEEDDIVFEQMDVEERVWHIQAAELLKLKDAQYKIDIKKDWYKSNDCYISTYGNDGQVIAILCTSHIIPDIRISDFLRFVQGQKRGIDNISYIWAIQDDVSFETKLIDGQSIKVTTENGLLNGLIDYTDYKRYIFERYEKHQLYDGSDLALNDVYVEPSCSVYDIVKKKNIEIESIEDYIANWINDNSQHKQLALLGEYGQGKSVLSLRLAYQLLKGKIKSDRIPIIIELRGRFIKQYNDPKEILYSWANRFDIKPKAILKLHNAGKLLLIFEGFDELELIGDEQIRKEHFRKLWEYSIPKSKIIITGRPNYFIDDLEMKTLLRLSQKQADGSKYCETINLLRFRKEQIVAAMRSLNPRVKKEIIEVYDQQSEKSSFRDLVSRPSLLFLTGLIWERENLASKVSNINSAEVIKAFLNYSYKRQDEKKDVKSIMNSDERDYFMQGIAIYMVSSHGYTNQIEARELDTIIEKLFNTFPDEITKNSSTANQKRLQNRLDQNHLLPAIKTDIRSCGVLVKDLSRDDTFCFAHKSFLEVLIADFITQNCLLKTGSSPKSIGPKKVATIAKTLGIDYLNDLFVEKNVFKFVVELLATEIQITEEHSFKENVNHIYRQLDLFPVNLKCLGWLNAISPGGYYRNEMDLVPAVYALGASFLVYFMSHLSLNILVSLIISLAVFLFMIGMVIYINYNRIYNLVRQEKPSRFQSLFSQLNKSFEPISRSVEMNALPLGVKVLLRLFFETRLLNSANYNRLFRLSSIKNIFFYHVCKNLHVEIGLSEVWPSFVYRNIQRVAEKWIKDSQIQSD